jgi:hypothetical protein
MPSGSPYLPSLIPTGWLVMCEFQHTIFQPAGRCSVAQLTESRVYSSLALPGLLHKGILLAVGLCLTPGAAVARTVDLLRVLVAEVIPVRFAAGHHLGHHVLFEHITVSQGVRGL